MSRLVAGPFNRVEGDLEIKLDVEDGAVTAAYVNSPLYRGFEQILAGKAPSDALVYTPRICGICSVSQSLASAAALAAAQGLTPSRNGALLQNFILAAENVSDHLTHFYMFFMPDFAQPVYASEPWYEKAAARFQAMRGQAQREFLPARAAFLHIMGTIAGHWPHTLGLQPGGTACAIGNAEQARLAAYLSAFRRFLETAVFGDVLERVAGLESESALDGWAAESRPASSDFGRFLAFAKALKLGELGKGPGVYLSYGAYAFEGRPTFAAGVLDRGALRPFSLEDIREDHASSWLVRGDLPRHPSHGLTLPDIHAEGAYSWCKAPRLGGLAVETGALARQLVDGHPLLRSLAAGGGGNVSTRIIARLIETARLIPAMERWIWEVCPGERFCLHAEMPEEARGAGLIEAARGALGHWLDIRKGRIFNYQIIAPTTWNFSPRDGKGQPGACEQALTGAPVRTGESSPIAVQHIVRSFDPCMVCTVH
ncbi:MAG: nickel-dependent hydrogenase large subunit [Rhodomicrobium sp.]